MAEDSNPKVESNPSPTVTRTSAKKKARELARYFHSERADYAYLKQVFHYLRLELELEVPTNSKKLPYVPSAAEIQKFYEVVWSAHRLQDALLIKTLLYTGVRVSELVNIKLNEVDVEHCQIKISHGKGGRDRLVVFPLAFREALAAHQTTMRGQGANYLFESSRRHKYSERGVRRMLERYSQQAGLSHPLSPHQLRHFLLTWLKTQGIDDAAIQPYSGHASRQSLEIYSKLSIVEAQKEYNRVINRFPV